MNGGHVAVIGFVLLVTGVFWLAWLLGGQHGLEVAAAALVVATGAILIWGAANS